MKHADSTTTITQLVTNAAFGTVNALSTVTVCAICIRNTIELVKKETETSASDRKKKAVCHSVYFTPIPAVSSEFNGGKYM